LRVSLVKSRKKRITVFIVLAFITVAGVLLGVGIFREKPGKEYSGEVETVRLGVSAGDIAALVYIAREKGFFRRHGLDVVLQEYQSGVDAVEELLKGRVDVATAAAFVLALQGFTHKDLRALGSICLGSNIEVIARRDRGIEKPADLKGKTIAYPKGTVAEFFLATFLTFNGVSSTSVSTVGFRPMETAEALSKGTVDAAIMFEPFPSHAKKALGSDVVSWEGQSGQDFYFLLLSREQFIGAKPGVVERLLRAFVDAEDYLKGHEAEVQDIVERTLHLDHQYLPNLWPRLKFHVRLDQDMLVLMEDQARWLLQNKRVDAGKAPNYFTFLYLAGLEKIKPEAVGVTH
jgi:ABC-type nitrate/sulfonate/bicarbonate transport system substrate-binding protein